MHPAAAELTFTQGTVLLRAPERLPEKPPDWLRWDPRVPAWRAPAARHRELWAWCRERLVAVRDEVPGPDPACGQWSPPELRPYQHAALLAWQLTRRRGIVVLPTGAGKTRLALAAMADTRTATLCLVPTRVLLQQWLQQIPAVWDGPVGILGDGEHRIEPITVATFASAWRWMGRIGARFGLLVVDEAHHFGHGQHDEALEMATAPARLGLTATPPEDPGRLPELVGPIVHQEEVGALVGRYLAPCQLLRLMLPLTREERIVYAAEVARFKAFADRVRQARPQTSWEELMRTASACPEGRDAMRALRRARARCAWTANKRAATAEILAQHRGDRLLLFTADQATAYAVAREFLVMPITADIPRRERAAALERFRRGELKSLVSARVLNEGLDVPDAEVAVVLGGTLGAREHAQRIGRCLRPAEGKLATVYELIADGTMEVRQAARRRVDLGPGRPARN